MHIIAILGLNGLNQEGELGKKAYYLKDKTLGGTTDSANPNLTEQPTINKTTNNDSVEKNTNGASDANSANGKTTETGGIFNAISCWLSGIFGKSKNSAENNVNSNLDKNTAQNAEQPNENARQTVAQPTFAATTSPQTTPQTAAQTTQTPAQTTAQPTSSAPIALHALQEGEFYNSTHCLIKSFPNAKYTFITTKKALEVQRKLFEKIAPQSIALFEETNVRVIGDSDIDEIFDHVLKAINNSEDSEIILDITHGMRHQPMVAAFASTLAQISSNKRISFLFAKETERFKKYHYTLLERFAQIAVVSLALNTFVKRFTFELPQGFKLLDDNTEFLTRLGDFSRALHANTPNELAVRNTLKELAKARETKAFNGLDGVLNDVERVLREFEAALSCEKWHVSYYKFARIMHEHGFYLIAATYASESLGQFLLEIFESKKLMKNTNDKGKEYADYDKIIAIKSLIKIVCEKREFKNKKCFIDPESAQKFVEKEVNFFQPINDINVDISDFRNDIVHLVLTTNPVSVKKLYDELNSLLNKLEELYKNDLGD